MNGLSPGINWSYADEGFERKLWKRTWVWIENKFTFTKTQKYGTKPTQYQYKTVDMNMASLCWNQDHKCVFCCAVWTRWGIKTPDKHQHRTETRNAAHAVIYLPEQTELKWVTPQAPPTRQHSSDKKISRTCYNIPVLLSRLLVFVPSCNKKNEGQASASQRQNAWRQSQRTAAAEKNKRGKTKSVAANHSGGWSERR